MTFDEMVQDAATRINAAYWAACDAAQAALDPADLTTEAWAVELLAESFEIAMRIEADPGGWHEGREKW